jgi:pimeloyl-ACP methyl ester carboxylesterase
MLKLRPSVLEADFRACDAFDFSKKLPEVQVPTLVMVGQEDKMTPVRFSEQLVEDIPDAALRIIPEAGHMLPLEKPRVVAEALISYFKTGLDA